MRWRYFDHWWRYLIIILPLKEAQISLLFDQISKSGDGGNLGIIFGYSSYSIYPSILVSTPIPNSSITSSTKAGTLRPGNSRNSFQKRFARALDHCANSGAEVIRN
jgi:hypothetical protein